jgi:hypothetical protein
VNAERKGMGMKTIMELKHGRCSFWQITVKFRAEMSEVMEWKLEICGKEIGVSWKFERNFREIWKRIQRVSNKLQ